MGSIQKFNKANVLLFLTKFTHSYKFKWQHIYIFCFICNHAMNCLFSISCNYISIVCFSLTTVLNKIGNGRGESVRYL